MKEWKVLKSDLALDTKWAKVRRDTVELSNGKVLDDYYYWEGGNFSQIFALTEDQKVILVRQYKHGVQEIVIELPAGLIEKDEDPGEAAKRELEEETGYIVDSVKSLGIFNVSSAKSTTKAHPFLATGARRNAKQNLDATEYIEVITVTISELRGMISDGRITDVNSIACTLRALQDLSLL